MRDFTRKAWMTGVMAATCALTVAACGEGDDLTGPDAPDEETLPAPVVNYEYKVTLTALTVAGDCDDEGFPTYWVDNDEEGEFAYRFKVSWPDGQETIVARSTTFGAPSGSGSGLFRASTGSRLAFGTGGAGVQHSRVFAGPQILAVTVTLEATEWDSRLDGWWREEWMDSAKASSTHSRRTTGSGRATLSVGESASKCRMIANYGVTIMPAR